MDTHYQPIYKEAAVVQHKYHDFTHTTAHDPAATAMRNQIHKLTSDLAANKDPRMIERNVRNMQKQIRRAQIGSSMAPTGLQSVLNRNQSLLLNRRLEGIRQNVLQHPNLR